MNRSSAPIFILGCHRSGTSAVAGLLVEAAGVSMGELMPPTEDNPLGYYEALGVVDAHRDVLRQLDRDWTCPPDGFSPEALDLSALREQVALHQQLAQPWAVKDPRSLFLLPAWSHAGIDRVRLVAVVRPVADTIRSIEKRDGIREDRAEAIVAAYTARLVSIAEQVPLPVVEFPGDETSVVDQVRQLASGAGLAWDDEAARAFFSDELVRNRSPLRDHSELHDRLRLLSSELDSIPEVELSSLKLDSPALWEVETHLGPRHAQQRSELWAFGDLSGFHEPTVVELLRDGARPGGPPRPGATVRQEQVVRPQTVGSVVVDGGTRPHAVVAHQMLTGLSDTDIETFFRSLYIATHPLAVVVVDVPEPHDDAVLAARPAVPDGPRPSAVRRIARESGWDQVLTDAVSPTRTGMTFRKRVRTDSELVPVVTSLLASAARLETFDARLRAVEAGDGRPVADWSASAPEAQRALEAERRRADALEHQLERLRGRRSIRLALRLADLWRPLFRLVRSWRR